MRGKKYDSVETMDEKGRQHLIKFIKLKINNGEVVGIYFSPETISSAVLTAMFRELPNDIQAEYRALLREALNPQGVGGDKHRDPPPGHPRRDGLPSFGH